MSDLTNNVLVEIRKLKFEKTNNKKPEITEKSKLMFTNFINETKNDSLSHLNGNEANLFIINVLNIRYREVQDIFNKTKSYKKNDPQKVYLSKILEVIKNEISSTYKIEFNFNLVA